ncbi:hypothetical protein OEZ85_007131 [Tetradesmus obliquus]|uniref:Uncharacterized protein n=1 Tax=Tetradesmus obliquus TaxID=3088 RepID=A0ABY8TXG0_TETOB|nr:hypothetical protein OEZ85_007131 [Tetradesmus obliquus]
MCPITRLDIRKLPTGPGQWFADVFSHTQAPKMPLVLQATAGDPTLPLAAEDQMSLEDWMMSLPPCMGGKRPRSPVEKLADLQGQADAEDEDNWRNSKRYLSEVIANGFSRLNFGMQQQQLSPQVLSLTSPRATGGSGGCYVQLPGGMLSPRDGGEWDMEMDSPPGCPGSGSSAGQAAAAAAGQRTSRSPSGKGNRPIIVTEALAGQQASPTGSPGGGASGHSPVQYPFGSYLPSQLGQHGPWVAQQHNTLQQAQQQQPMRQQVLQPPAQHQQDQQPTSLELTAERLQQLRAKALASTSRLTELEPEDLASLQLSITASQARRGSADHTPSHLHSARAAAEARRHSSHI